MKIQVLQGDCLGILKTIPDNSVDAVVTDPPYGLGKEPDPVVVMQAWARGESYAASGGGFMGAAWDAFVPQPVIWREVLRVLKPGGHILCACGTRTQDWMTMALRFAGFEIRDVITWVYSTGFPKSLNVAQKLKDKDEAAEDFAGIGTALKPAVEFWTLGRKPLAANTIAENVKQWGCGGINIDKCRVGTIDTAKIYGGDKRPRDNKFGNGQRIRKTDFPIGRYPCNLIHDGSPDVTALFPESTSTGGDGSKFNDSSRNALGNSIKNRPKTGKNGLGFGDSGSASRFFYCAKPSPSERSAGLSHLKSRRKKVNVIQTEGVKNGGITQDGKQLGSPAQNFHPTVKPIRLMRYLCRLIGPNGGTILDPFCGSGTTGIGAVLEGFGFIGIEREEDFAEIAKYRIQHYARAVGRGFLECSEAETGAAVNSQLDLF